MNLLLLQKDDQGPPGAAEFRGFSWDCPGQPMPLGGQSTPVRNRGSGTGGVASIPVPNRQETTILCKGGRGREPRFGCPSPQASTQWAVRKRMPHTLGKSCYHTDSSAPLGPVGHRGVSETPHRLPLELSVSCANTAGSLGPWATGGSKLGGAGLQVQAASQAGPSDSRKTTAILARSLRCPMRGAASGHAPFPVTSALCTASQESRARLPPGVTLVMRASPPRKVEDGHLAGSTATSTRVPPASPPADDRIPGSGLARRRPLAEGVGGVNRRSRRG